MRLRRIILILAATFIAVNANAQTYSVDPASTLTWTGKKVTGKHNGTVTVKKGTVTFKDSQLVSGSFEIDMDSIAVLDIKDPKYNEKLTKHLKSDDFFSSEEFPVSTFTLTNAKQITEARESEPNYTISGDLSVKGVTFPLSFPAKITIGKDSVSADASTKVDRTKYNVRYGSGKFFENLGDKLIYDDFEIELHLTAKAG